MIRKFEKKDINAVMKIWKNENIRAHNFIAKANFKIIKFFIIIKRSIYGKNRFSN